MSQSRKSISFLLPSHWLSFSGGAEYQAKLLIDRLAETTTYDLSYLGRRVIEDADTPYRIVNIGSPRWYSKYSKAFDRPYILRALKEIEPDLIYQRVAGPYTGVAADYAEQSGCKFIWHIAHDTDLDREPRGLNAIKRALSRVDARAIERGFRQADAIIAQTHYQAKLLEERFATEVTAVIPNFHPEVPVVRRNGINGRVVWIANVRAFKGPEVFMRLAETLGASAGVEFVMIGRDESGGRFSREIERQGATSNVRYLGELPQEEVNSLLEESDILVNTSVQEGFPNTFIQAWMRGTAVVSLSVDPDGVLSERGLGVCCGTEAILVETVQRLLVEEEMRTELSRRARRYVIENHSLRNADKLIERMRELL